MSDPYAPPGSQRDPARGGERQRAARQLPPSSPQPSPPSAERRPPDAEGSLRTAKLGMRFSLLVLAGLVALYLRLPWSLGSLAFLLVGAGFGIAAIVSAVRARLRASTVVALSLGLAMTALLVVLVGTQLLLLPLSLKQQRCADSAITATAQQACQAEFQQGFGSLLPSPGG